MVLSALCTTGNQSCFFRTCGKYKYPRSTGAVSICIYKTYLHFIHFRPGNFATHARRCLELLIDVLRDTSDLSSLVYITQQLKARVDPSKYCC